MLGPVGENHRTRNVDGQARRLRERLCRDNRGKKDYRNQCPPKFGLICTHQEPPSDRLHLAPFLYRNILADMTRGLNKVYKVNDFNSLRRQREETDQGGPCVSPMRHVAEADGSSGGFEVLSQPRERMKQSVSISSHFFF